MVCAVLGEDMATADEEMEMATVSWDEDYGEQLNVADVEAGMKGEEQLMEKVDVAEEVPRVDVPCDARTRTGRSCHRKKEKLEVDMLFASIQQRLGTRMRSQTRLVGSVYECSSRLHTFRSLQQ